MVIKVGKFQIEIGRTKASINSWVGPEYDEWFGRNMNAPGTKSKTGALNSYRGLVFDCVNLISNRVSTADLELYYMKGKEEVPIEQHPFLDVWEMPNNLFSGRMLRELVQAHLDLCGEGYIIKIKNGLGMTVEMWPALPSDMTVKYNSGGYYFEQKTDKGTIRHEWDDVIYLRYANPSDPIKGYSPLMAKGMNYDTDLAIDAYTWHLFRENGWVPFALTTDQSLTAPQAQQIQQAWMNKVRRLADKFTVPVMDKGLKITTVGSSPMDLGTFELSESMQTKILMAYGVPRALLGDMENVVRQTYEGAEYAFAKGTVEPRLDTWVDGLVPTLRAMDKRIKARFKSVVPKDREALRADLDMSLRNGIISVEEAREKLGYEPDFRKGDTVLVPFNMIPGGWGRSSDDMKALPVPKVKGWTTEQKDVIWQKFAKDTEARERRWMPAVRKWIAAYEKDALAIVRDQHKAWTFTYEGWSTRKVLKDFKAPTPDADKYETMIIDIAGRLHRKDFEEAGVEAAAVLNTQFNMENPAVDKYLGEKTRLFATEQVKRLSDDLTTLLRQSVADGLTLDETTQAVKDLYQMEETYRAERIARTEVISGSNKGRLEAYSQGGVKKKSWLSSRDNSARWTHLKADEDTHLEPVPVNEYFKVGDAYGPAPGSMSDPAESINCRCTILPVLEDE